MDQLGTPPDILFLSLHKHLEWQEEMEHLKHAWPTLSLIGLLCSGNMPSTPIDTSTFQYLEDFLFCPFHELDISIRLHKVLHAKLQRIDETTVPSSANPESMKGLIGQSPPFLQAIAKTSLLAKCEGTVHISGQTGTGKELFARAIHYQSHRSHKPFIPINCGGLPDHLFENELFGHAKGAFTDASSEHNGLVQEAEGGTIFLDEVDTLSTLAQVKLLRFLQAKEYRPLGAAKTKVANVRVLVASNADLQQLVQEKKLREDLYYRLNILSMVVPTLRERVTDIPILAQHFLAYYGRLNGREKTSLSPEAIHVLMEYSWPGNVRELEAVIQRSIAFTSTPTIFPEDLDISSSLNQGISSEASMRTAKATAVENFERTYLMKVLLKYGGNVSRAAQASGKERRSFQRLMRKYDLYSSTFQEQH